MHVDARPHASSGSAPRRSGRPSRPAITEEDIAREALSIIDELGWEACTMRLLATRLGVRAPSLYHHVDGQLGVVHLVRDRIVREIHDPAILDLSWDDAFRVFAMNYYRVFAQHPNTIQVLSTTPVRDALTITMYETFLRALVSDGWSAAEAFSALQSIEHLALGFAYEWNVEDLMVDPAQAARADAPLLAAATRKFTDGAASSETSFFTLIDHQIDMYRREFAASTDPDRSRSTPSHPTPSTDERTPA